MSAKVIELRPREKWPADIPAIVSGEVNLLLFSEALARAGLVGRHDADKGAFVIEPAGPEGRWPKIPEAERLRLRAAGSEAERGMCWYNSLSRADRARWRRIAGSAVPADAWAAFRAAKEAQPD